MGKSAKFYKKKPKLGKGGEHGGGDGAAERYDKEEEVGAAAKARAMKVRLAEEARQKRAKGPDGVIKRPVEAYDEVEEDEDQDEVEDEEGAGKQSIAKRPRGSGGAAKLRGKAASKKGQDTKEDDYRVPRDRGIDYIGQWELGPGRKKR
ncbi:hypothetical protein FA10DRAFT_265793 [Acaromyces ingoldii]|uniref:Uncharacterized protein n=1 Tax=Acaromyces ingoldii TaxID=215250 RepID=A0A316YRQ1_9BASI|nr:hypothetical protein FA10DRAFT_265793 [Acaromyces ingoldii]PWN91979.1 hypothetical protein FA10DRAFT_265793 [Acaromyces ingoldii]